MRTPTNGPSLVSPSYILYIDLYLCRQDWRDTHTIIDFATPVRFCPESMRSCLSLYGEPCNFGKGDFAAAIPQGITSSPS